MTLTRRPDTEVRPTAPPPRVRRYRTSPEVVESRSRVNTAVIIIVVAVLITAVGLLYLIQTNHVASLGYEMSQLQRERATLSIRNEQLNYSIARYESLNQIESIAIGQVGMTPSEDYVFIDVPRPSAAQLPPPEPVAASNPSVLQRIWNGLAGSSVAVSPDLEAGR